MSQRPRHAFLVRDPAVITPFEARAAELWLLGGTVEAHTMGAFGRAGLSVERADSWEEASAKAAALPGGAVVTYDSVAFSKTVLDRLLEASTKESGSIAAALPEGRSTKLLSHLDGLERTTVGGVAAYTAPLAVVRTGGAPSPTLLPYKEDEWKVKTPLGMIGAHDEPFAGTDMVMVRIAHWSHVMRVNHAALVAQWLEKRNTLSGLLWYLWRAIAGFPWTRGRLAQSFHVIHRKAQVHHSALVEFSIVEEGAAIGANAVIRGSYIAKGARIDDCAVVSGSVIGENAFVANCSAMMGCVLFPDSFAAQTKMQFAVLGTGAVAFTGSFFYDINFDRNVHVMHRGKLVDCGARFLSVCLGPWARVAGGVWIASGREVPAGSLIVQPPDLVAHKLDPAIAQTRMTTIVQKRLVELGELPPNKPADYDATHLPAKK